MCLVCAIIVLLVLLIRLWFFMFVVTSCRWWCCCYVNDCSLRRYALSCVFGCCFALVVADVVVGAAAILCVALWNRRIFAVVPYVCDLVLLIFLQMSRSLLLPVVLSLILILSLMVPIAALLIRFPGRVAPTAIFQKIDVVVRVHRFSLKRECKSWGHDPSSKFDFILRFRDLMLRLFVGCCKCVLHMIHAHRIYVFPIWRNLGLA